MLFELLFLIYLLPVIVLIGLLLKAARWIIVSVFRLAIWIIKTAFALLWKGLGLLIGLVVGNMVANHNQTNRGRYN